MHLKDFVGLSLLCFGILASFSFSVVSEGTPLIDDITHSPQAQKIFDSMVAEGEEPIFGKTNLESVAPNLNTGSHPLGRILLKNRPEEITNPSVATRPHDTL